MFDTDPDERTRDSQRIKGFVGSLIGLIAMLADDVIRRPEASVWRILTYVGIVITILGQLRRADGLDPSSRVRVGLFSTVGAVLLVAGLYAGSLSVWLMGLALLVVAWLVPRWYSESGGPVMHGPDVH